MRDAFRALAAVVAIFTGFPGSGEAQAPGGIVLAQRNTDGTTGGCTPIRFGKGATSATVSGNAPAETRDRPAEPLCYALAVTGGQRARVRLLSGENVAISIKGVGDAKDAFDFTTRRGTYELLVFTLFPTGRSAPFRMHVEVSPVSEASRPRELSEGAPSSALAAPGKLAGRWLGLHSGVRFPDGCDSGEPILYSPDGTYAHVEVTGKWRLEGNRLTETPLWVNELAGADPANIGRPFISRITWEGPDKFVLVSRNRRMTFQRCP